MNVASLPPLEELVPHRGVSLLLERVLACDETTTTCSVGLQEQRWLKNTDGSIPSWLAIEYMAQCMAVHESIKAWLEGREPDIGLLAAVSNFKAHIPLFDPHQPLRTHAARLRGNRDLKAFTHACSVVDDRDTIVAEGRFTVALVFPDRDPQN